MTDSTAAASAWDELKALPRPRLNELFAADAGRVGLLSAKLAIPEGEILLDWSKTHLDAAHIAGFEKLTAAMDFHGRRAAMFNGEHINTTEDRAVEHTALRGVGKETSVEEAEALKLRMRGLVDAIYAGTLGEVRYLISIGIGGSALGPRLGVDALGGGEDGIDVHIVSNIDGVALEDALDWCDPETTLIAVASKTFTTTETMINAQSAIEWLEDNGVADPYGRVIALTADPEKAVEWGVDETRILPFSESVGGRYSLWSSIGFPIAVAIGWDGFQDFLDGASAVDRHFRDNDGLANLPLRAAWADLLYTHLRGTQTRACFAYDQRLDLLPDYLQQLEMESNGKRVTIDGALLEGPSAPITWGGVGTDAQHAVFQLLHQGKVLVPVDFIAYIAPGDNLDPAHHRTLLQNCFAQGAALMAGKPAQGTDKLAEARAYPGDRPSATILLDDLTPASLGALIAFHEHRTFANGILLGINSFDQFGVELGKEIAKSMDKGGSFDASTEALLKAAGIK